MNHAPAIRFLSLAISGKGKCFLFGAVKQSKAFTNRMGEELHFGACLLNALKKWQNELTILALHKTYCIYWFTQTREWSVCNYDVWM